MPILTFDEKNFEKEVLKEKEKIVLVDFFAEWCPPCQAMKPILEEISENFKEIKVGKVDIEKSPKLAEDYQIISIPTLIFFKDGEIIERITGFLPFDDLSQRIKNLLS